MNGPGPQQLPRLSVGDFAPGLDHVAEAYQRGKVFAILRRDDPARVLVPSLVFPVDDIYTYLFIHGGDEITRFQNLPANPTHEVPTRVVAALMRQYYGARLSGMFVRVCACYGTLVRPGDTASAVQQLARELPQTAFEGYHALVHLRARPVEVRLGDSIQWDPVVGPVIVGPPGGWEPVAP